MSRKDVFNTDNPIFSIFRIEFLQIRFLLEMSIFPFHFMFSIYALSTLDKGELYYLIWFIYDFLNIVEHVELRSKCTDYKPKNDRVVRFFVISHLQLGMCIGWLAWRGELRKKRATSFLSAYNRYILSAKRLVLFLQFYSRNQR